MKTSILAICLLAGCALEGETTVPELGQLSQGLGSSNVTDRPLVLTNDMLTDWTEGKQISTALVTGHTLKVRYCAAHFPASSTQLANLMSALGTYNGAAGVAINLVDVAAQPGTTTHPNLDTLAAPADTIYLDYDDRYPSGSGVYAATGFDSCDSSSPKQCTQAHTYINEKKYTAALGSPSKGVFVHELGHVFGMKHINEDKDTVTMLDPQDMWFDRTTIHGSKYDGEDTRGIAIQAGTLAFLRHYYAATTDGTLGTDEIVANRAFSFVGDTVGTTTPHYEWDPAKVYNGWGTAGSLIDCVTGQCLNEVKLRWNPTLDIGTGTAGGFEPCAAAAGTLPHWFARMSETSTNTVDKLFESVFEVTNSDAGTNWFPVATETFHSYSSAADFRQIDWDTDLGLSLAAFGLPSAPAAKTLRKLRFRADSNNSLLERNGANNDWDVNLCLYPANSACSSACAQ